MVVMPFTVVVPGCYQFFSVNPSATVCVTSIFDCATFLLIFTFYLHIKAFYFSFVVPVNMRMYTGWPRPSHTSLPSVISRPGSGCMSVLPRPGISDLCRDSSDCRRSIETAGHPGRRSPSCTPNTSVFSKHPGKSGILRRDAWWNISLWNI